MGSLGSQGASCSERVYGKRLVSADPKQMFVVIDFEFLRICVVSSKIKHKCSRCSNDVKWLKTNLYRRLLEILQNKSTPPRDG